MAGTLRPQTDLAPGQSWAARFEPCDIDTSELPPLGEFVTVHRGKTTGDVDFFRLTQDDVDEYGASEEHLMRLIRRPKLVEGYDFREEDWEELRAAGEEVWLLDPDELPGIRTSPGEFEKQVKHTADSLLRNDDGEVPNIISYLQDSVSDLDPREDGEIETRPCWYRPRRQASPRVVVPDGDRDGLPFVLNETVARNINNYRGLYEVALSETELKALLGYLNSTVGQQVV